MKHLILLVGLLVASFVTIHAQTLVMETAENKTLLETCGTVKFKGANITLKNTMIKCKTIVLENTVKTLTLEGTVEIDCKDFQMTNATTAIEIVGTGTLNIQYSGSFKDNKRDLSIKNANAMNVSIVKSP